MTDTTDRRRRAPGMTPDRRRAMIVQAALPLLATHGATLTTAQVARAAGIGEATVFRAFADKEALLDACVVEVLRPDTVLDELAAIPLTQPLGDRLSDAASALLAHFDRLGAVLGALHAAGRPGRGRPGEQTTADAERGAAPDGPATPARPKPVGADRPPASAREESALAVREAVAALFAPERDRLRLPADRLAGLFLAVLLPARPPLALAAPTPAELVDLFLHGALSRDPLPGADR
ncbi:TetR family transcriptional regulator [Micromonospora sp. 4G57]|uniref:TetR family transcriptional regulator n=1 Tax=Micromonospora sicca TaxID=2202420 RepID=A0ABU5J8G7_9ACTN|nr:MULTISPECIES: TetR family transcriptional regulator [unclassified Micromonospora]MDZ5443671.1 TetR family transcriptional regulator [Micromonospora sp. 4G57]MDZ5488857.1 TetR family transcriptional regulator [Micromonospora sp. 4G53]